MPACKAPVSSPWPTIPAAIRSFMLPVGFAPSHFAQSSAPPSGSAELSRTRGVLPIASSPAAIRASSSGSRLARYPPRGRRDTLNDHPGVRPHALVACRAHERLGHLLDDALLRLG